MRNLRIAFLAICVSILAFWIGRNAHRNKATFTPPQTVRAAIDEEDPIEREPLTSFDSVGSVAEPTIPEESTFALANELLISFSNIEAMNEFELKAKQRGLRILDRSEALASLRLQYRNEADRNLMGRLAGDDASIDRNYIVVTPTLPESPANVGSRAFADGALDWIGIREDNSSWGKGVTVAILDTAILDHASLTDASIRVVDLAKSEGSDQEIYNSHGTAVASLVAGADIGVAPSASIIGIQVMESNGTGDSFTLAQGIVEAVDQGASVISMSLGSYGSSAPLENAINYALERDVVLVASADSASQTASFSNFGLGTDIAAPGVGIYAAWNESEWASFSGTSASTPLVAGSVAAILSLEPNLQPNEAADLLLEYANDSGPAGDDLYLGA
jgi:subtilisin family serine protease